MENSEKNQHNQQAILQVNGSDFFQIAHGDDYVLYQAGKKRKIGDSVADIFLENAIDKTIYAIQAETVARQCSTGRYNRILSIRTEKE